MSLTLTVDGERWRAHLRELCERTSGIVPVAKGNGYGFTLGRLARKAQWLSEKGLGVDTLAVGTYEELPEVASRFHGSLLVLTPWRPWVADPDPAIAGRVIHTVSRPGDLGELVERRPRARVVLERMTSMRRHGMTARELWVAGPTAQSLRARVEGVAIHLPLNHRGHLAEVTHMIDEIAGAGLDSTTVWVSHLTDAEIAELRGRYADLTFRPRIGTRLWLGDREALRVTATVLDVHPVESGDVYGYRTRKAPGDGHLVVVSVGTAHGIGLEAPTGDRSARARAATLARGGLDAVGRVRSPFTVGGGLARFAEPPHMQASMLFLPAGVNPPAVGDRVPVRVRYTATGFDRIQID
jgi:alanine racemase